MAETPAPPRPAPPPQQARPPQREGRPRDRPPRHHDSGPRDRNTVFIGNKPPMNYVLAVVTQFNSGSAEVSIRARGKAISQAVDVAEIVRNKFFTKATVRHVGISTEQITGDDGRRRSVSAIDIRLANPEAAPTTAAPAAKPSSAPAPSPPATG